ncbi:hypothetical protein WSM22_27890 [Cytophagales bacterium WSM2-2]|nr:hypothetical protein WSM22_27890 [Cytophagales bacterium WSM2-2]
MFKPTPGHMPEALKKEVTATEKNYVIQKNDKLRVELHSFNGERLIDPNPEMTGGAKNEKSTSQDQSSEQNTYLVDINGMAKLPILGEIKLEGLTLRQAEEVLQKKYAESAFKDSFVKMSFVNKRVIVLGAPGGQVIPLNNTNVRVAEILAMSKGVDNNAKAHNIRLIRDTHVYQIDFSTIQGYMEGNMIVESGDIVYVEPIRRPLTEGLRDYSLIIYPLISLITILVVNSSK